jgi:hypothetical protein
MRARNIKPGFYKNDELAECSLLARFIFPGLWMIADSSGRLEDRPKRIKGELLPFDNADVSVLLDELERYGFIKRYTVDGLRLIWIPGFLKHQNPHHREAVSDFPPHPDEMEIEQAPGQAQPREESNMVEPQASPGQAPGQAQPRHGRAGLIPSSLIPDSLIPDSSLREPPLSPTAPTTPALGISPADAGGVCVLEQPQQVEVSAQPSGYTKDFESFWEAYPRKKAKEAAWKAWKNLGKSRPPISHLHDAIARAKQGDDWQRDGGKYIPHPATWLNQKRWLDEIRPPTSIGSKLTNHNAAVAREWLESRQRERQQ